MYANHSKLFLLDTNVISEIKKDVPDKNVMAWMDALDIARTYISVVSVCEIRKGINKMSSGKRQKDLSHWLEHDLLEIYKDRTLGVDWKVADCWGALIANHGGHYDEIDLLISAIAMLHDLTLVTRNEKHFDIQGLRILNPWLKK